MNNFLSILKVGLINSLNINKLKKRNRESNISIIALIFIVLVALFFLVIFGFYMYIFEDMFISAGRPELVLLVGIFFAFIMCIMTTITKVNGYLFRAKDFELLTALPVKTTTIISAKLTNLVIINYLICFYCLAPTLFVYSLFNPTSVYFWVIAVLLFFLLPFIPIALCGVVLYLLGFIPLKRKLKNILSTIVSLAFLALIAAGSFFIEAAEEDPTKFVETIDNVLKKVNYFGSFAFSGLQGNVIHFLIFAIISLILFGGFILLVSTNYQKTNNNHSSGEVNKNFKLTAVSSSSQTKAIFLKEIKKYFSTPVYILNTIVGPLISVIITVVMARELSSQVEVLGEFGGLISLILLIMIVFMVSLTSTTACSLSLEGKNFWIIKSSPVKAKTVFMGKIIVNLIITIPFIIIDAIIALIMLKIGLVEVLALIVIPSIFAISISILGLYMNILLPRFDYEQEVKAIKQSLSVLATMGITFLISFVLVLVLVILEPFFPVMQLFLIIFLFSVLVLGLSIGLILTSGVKRYERINC